jgi:DNA-binding NarL/FixJ family response regulator
VRQYVELVESQLEAGARGYLIKSDAVQELADAVATCARETYMSKRLNREWL